MIIGMDVSKHSLDVAWTEGEVTHHQRYAYTKEGLSSLLADTPPDSQYVMEATGIYHTRVALALHSAGRAVSVINPLTIKRFAQMRLSRIKSDKADARLIEAYGQAHAVPRWEPSARQLLELQQAHRWLDDLIVERTRLSGRVEASAYSAQPSAFVTRQMQRQARHLDKQIRECEQHLEVLVKKSFPELYARLLSIPSVGPKTALELIIITAGFARFKEAKALCAYVGVCPTTYESGSSVKGVGHIAKRGQGRLRQLLYLCSWTAKRCNPGCRSLYERLKAVGKPPKVIQIAIAHKLLRQAFAVAMKEEFYSPEFA